MDQVDVLGELDELRQLKARYCRLLDAKDWPAWRALFTDDFVSDLTAAGSKVVRGGDEFVAFLQKTLGSPRRVTVHQVSGPELELLSSTSARGVWALHDLVKFAPGFGLDGYGHYHETYEKIDGVWRIKSQKLTRTREDIVTPVFRIHLSASVRRLLGRFIKQEGV